MNPTLQTLRLTLALALSALSFSATGLGVGEIELLSKLGEPLQAQITLNNVGDLGEDDLLIKLAPQDVYQRMGVERGHLASNLLFTVEGNTLKVTTRQPIKEPYLNFILQFRWPSGELYREFKLLVDPVH